MLWPLGAIGSGATAYDALAALLARASQAVRDVDASTRIMIHIDKGANNALYRTFFSNLISLGVGFDVILIEQL